MKYLVGYTGFVGSNLNKNYKFDGIFNSKNIEEAYDKKPDLLVYAGVPATKFLANKEPKKDFEVIENAINNIKKINPKEIVLISTIDIYKNPDNVNEESQIDIENLHPYGYNRYCLEKWVSENIDNYLIVRLPGIYGEGIKKNFIYDLINIIPSMLTKEKYEEIISKDNYIKNFYEPQENDFYKLKDITKQERQKLKQYFKEIGFSALNFTDSRGIYQFYNLKNLWNHIEIARKNKIKVLNLATEPIQISNLYQNIENKTFTNKITNEIPKYNFKTKYAKLFNGKDGYIYNKEFILEDIKNFVQTESGK